MKLVVPAEIRAGERRVSVVPDIAKRLVDAGWEVAVEVGAGDQAQFSDEQYRAAGATIEQAPAIFAGAAVVASVNPLSVEQIGSLDQNTLTLSFFAPSQQEPALRALIAKDATVVSFDLLPRISRAQSMDALSSQATVSGYRAGLAAAEHLAKFFPMFMTAAGTVPPAKVLVMGVGVAGLQAIATARRLGAVVRAYDVRSAAKEEAESLGATFVNLGVTAEGTGGYARELSPEELDQQRAALAAEVGAADVLITTAAVPGRKAPILVTTQMIEGMGPGAVIIDMAADGGGNCEGTIAGEEHRVANALLVGLSNPPAQMPTHASFLYARNVFNLLELFSKDGSLAPDWNDEIVIGTTIVRDGAVTHGPTAELLGVAHAPITPDAGGTTS